MLISQRRQKTEADKDNLDGVPTELRQYLNSPFWETSVI